MTVLTCTHLSSIPSVARFFLSFFPSFLSFSFFPVELAPLIPVRLNISFVNRYQLFFEKTSILVSILLDTTSC